jgi:TolB protein
MRRSRTVLGSAITVIALTLLTPALPGFAGSGGHAGRPGESAGDRAPGGGQIVFRRYFNDDQTEGALFVMSSDGSDLRQVSFPPDGWRDNVPAWSPDGSAITFERFAEDDSTSKIMVLDAATGDTRTVVPCTGQRCVLAIDPYFTPDGRTVAYARLIAPATPKPPEWKLYSAIFVVGLDGSKPRQLTSTPTRRPGLLAPETSDPTFSPDGKMLGFIRTRFSPDENSAVFVQPVGSPGKARRITPWRLNCQDRPTFAPDGTLMLFRCQPHGEDGPSNLYLVHPDGSDLARLTHASSRQYLGSGFSPDFRRGHGWITAGRTGGAGEDGNADVLRLLIRHGSVVQTENLTNSEEWDSGPGWAPIP